MNIPKAVLAQFIIGFVTALIFLVAIFYGISDFDAVIDASKVFLFPITEIYHQATGSRGGALGLILILLVQLTLSTFGIVLTCSRGFFALARDNAMPFSGFFAKVNKRNRNPTNAILFCATFTSLLGLIYIGSAQAFSAFVGAFVVLTMLSYLMAILPHILSRRSNVKRGWFWMGSAVGYTVNVISCLFIAAFTVLFFFPATSPTSAGTMNYTCLMVGGLSLIVGAFWLIKQGEYKGPPPFQERVTAKDAL